jgi:peptide/nickel transport system substrate-binding protein
VVALRIRAFVVLIAISAAACGEASDQARQAGSVQAETGGIAVVGVTSGATTLLPPLAAAALDFELGANLFLALNFAVWESGHLEYPTSHPLALAKSWTLESGDASLTYVLDSSHRWSDGKPVRAADVVFTYGLLADTALALPLSSTTERLDSVVAVNDSTVTFHFDGAYPGMLFDTGVGIIPEHVYGAVPPERMRGMPEPESADGPLVVSGPFGLAEWQPTDRIVLERNAASALQPRLDRIVIRVLPDETARTAELRSGELDVVQIGSFRAAYRLSQEPGIQILRIEQRGFDYIAWNPEGHPAFADVRVRTALSLALDRSSMIEALDMSDYAEPAFGPYGSLFPHLATPSQDEPAHDPERAAALLEEAGWTDVDGDGVREKNGASLSFLLSTTAGSDRREGAVQIIQSQLAEVGVRAEVQVEEFRSLLGRAMAGEYEAALLGWQVGLDPDISMFWRDAESPFNLVGFANDDVSALIDSARGHATAESAAPFWRQAGEEIASEYPYAWLWFFDLPLAVGPRVRDVRVSVTGFGIGMSSWWIPSDLRRRPR